MNKIQRISQPGDTIARPSPSPALGQFLKYCLATYAGDHSGHVADYIPELSKSNPAHFGVALATIDGHVYEAGDSAVEFTIQSISKAFVFALALEIAGHERVEAKIGVEPSGEAFNSIRLTADNRPFNAMVNAGAIACSGLIHSVEGSGAFERVRDALSRFAGRELGIDEAVFESERATGDRNRAIGFMLRNYSVVQGNVDEVLDVYFRQCSILVTARDIAVMAGTLANSGVNPVTGERVISPYAVARTLSVMTSSGMYDYAGEWVYRVGIPAKSGVGGGIIASLPGQFGLGTFSPPLDSHGNSVRGLKVCEALSAHFHLHMLNRTVDVRTSIIADYDIKGISSRRMRQPHEQVILDEHHRDIRVIELVGALTFSNVDFVTRKFSAAARPDLLIVDLRRVPAVTEGAALLLADMVRDLASLNVTVVFCGAEKDSGVWTMIRAGAGAVSEARRFDLLDEAIEWAEDQLIYRFGGFSDGRDSSPLNKQVLLTGLKEDELADLAAHATARSFHNGERIVATGEPASSIFFLLRGMVSVKLASGVRLASLSHGMVFGEMALIEDVRSADVWADTSVTCLELSIPQFEVFCGRHRHVGRRISQNLAVLLAKRLIQANAKVDLLSAY
ncbi:MAG TPA: glutaminase A [Pseudolabrys sp.]